MLKHIAFLVLITAGFVTVIGFAMARVMRFAATTEKNGGRMPYKVRNKKAFRLHTKFCSGCYERLYKHFERRQDRAAAENIREAEFMCFNPECSLYERHQRGEYREGMEEESLVVRPVLISL